MIYKSFGDIVTSMIDYLRLVQNNLDTKPGTVARDLFVDSPSQEIAEVYTQLRNVAHLSSMFSASGKDLDNLAANFGVTRNPGQAAIGVATFTASTLSSDVLIPAGSVVVSNNGISFTIVTNVVMKSTSANVYKATATRLNSQLILAGITDTYAVQVNVEALTLGSNGNIGQYALVSQNISGITNVTNLASFSGGTDPESDDAFRTRILGVFAGSNTGTALGYENTVNAVAGVENSTVVGPGDPLMTRDGTVTSNNNGVLTIMSAGSGGDVDIYILGSDLIAQTDSFIYVDQSGTNDPTNPANNFVLGQQGQSTALNIQQRRINEIASGTLPYQPVENIISVSGSSSGPNFVQQYKDDVGISHGNFVLVKDSGSYGGSSFGLDSLAWISDLIELDAEQVTKGIFNGADAVQYTGVEEIQNIVQNYTVTNESNFISSTNQSELTVKHTPINRVTRVVNLTTGERYAVANQNPDGVAGQINTSGKIIISGNTLPSSTDILQTDYTWVKEFDRVFDFDNLKDYNANRTAQSSVDWSFGNLIQNESAVVALDTDGYEILTMSSPVYNVLSVLRYNTQTASVYNGAIALSYGTVVSNVISARRITDNAELFNTDSHSGVLTGTNVITLPTDSLAINGDSVTVLYNAVDVFASDAYGAGTFKSNVIHFSHGIVVAGEQVLVNYIANVSTLIPESNISLLPIMGLNNGFVGATPGYQPTTNALSGGVVINNLRRAATNLQITVGSIPSSGTLSVLGTTIHKVSSALIPIVSSGYTIDLSKSIMTDMGVTSLPSTVKIAKVYSAELVSLNSSELVTTIDYTYDLVNYGLADNSSDINIALVKAGLTNTQFSLPLTTSNESNPLDIGDALLVTFYYINTASNESVFFSTNGTQISENVFTHINEIYVNSGFTNMSYAISGVFSVSNFNQPSENSTYNVSYDYVAPQENERITITYNYNQVVDAATMAIESVRPITADVLVKQATALDINVSVQILLISSYLTQQQTVIQNVTSAITSYLVASSMGTTVYSSGLISAVAVVPGVAQVTILNFSLAGGNNTASITALGNQYLNAGTINVKVGN